MATDFQERARRLAAGVYVAPEAHTEYTALGFAGSPPVSPDGIARPEMKSYFTSRSACMGQVPGEVVVAAFGCFNPKVVTRRRTPRAAVTTRTGSRLNLLTVAGFACLGPAGLFALYGLYLIVPAVPLTPARHHPARRVGSCSEHVAATMSRRVGVSRSPDLEDAPGRHPTVGSVGITENRDRERRQAYPPAGATSRQTPTDHRAIPTTRPWCRRKWHLVRPAHPSSGSAGQKIVKRKESTMTEPAEDTPVLDLLANMTAASLAASSLDPETLALVRVAALVALDAPPVSYILNLEAAADLGIDGDRVRGVLAAIAPIVGTARVASATGKIVEALAIEIEIAELVAEQADA